MEPKTTQGSRISRFFKGAFLLSILIGLSACATTKLTPLPESHPANPSAQEAPVTPRKYNLQPDEATTRTRELLDSKETSSASSSKPRGSDEKKDSDAHMNHGGMK